LYLLCIVSYVCYVPHVSYKKAKHKNCSTLFKLLNGVLEMTPFNFMHYHIQGLRHAEQYVCLCYCD